MTLTLWAITSCRSRAMRARSAATAARARSSRPRASRSASPSSAAARSSRRRSAKAPRRPARVRDHEPGRRWSISGTPATCIGRCPSPGRAWGRWTAKAPPARAPRPRFACVALRASVRRAAQQARTRPEHRAKVAPSVTPPGEMERDRLRPRRRRAPEPAKREATPEPAAAADAEPARVAFHGQLRSGGRAGEDLHLRGRQRRRRGRAPRRHGGSTKGAASWAPTVPVP